MTEPVLSMKWEEVVDPDRARRLAAILIIQNPEGDTSAPTEAETTSTSVGGP